MAESSRQLACPPARRAMFSSVLVAWSRFAVCITLVLLQCASLARAFVPTDHQTASANARATTWATFAKSGMLGNNDDSGDSTIRNKRILIYWRGEALEDYSKDFRLLEFTGALRAVLEGRCWSQDEQALGLDLSTLGDSITFTNALVCSDEAAKDMSEREVDLFNSSLQYLEFACPSDDDAMASASFADMISLDDLKKTVERCSLVNSIYQIGALEQTYEELNSKTESSGTFADLINGDNGTEKKWRFRLRYFGSEGGRKGSRFGNRTTRSVKRERDALSSLEPLLAQFGGKVDLESPDVNVVLFEGIGQEGKEMALTRHLGSGPQISVMNPNTRVCVTNTPLCPIAAYSMCNIARVGPKQAILDPYSGSCATLLAATLIEPTVKCVGVEIAHDGLVNRRDIVADFTTRGLQPPVALVEGDATHKIVRDKAVETVGGPFDVICADPPYGLRESLSSNPLQDMLNMIAKDRDAGHRLLKVGGRMAVFVPLSKEDNIDDVLPKEDVLIEVGLRQNVVQRQQLNDGLDRFLVAYECIG